MSTAFAADAGAARYQFVPLENLSTNPQTVGSAYAVNDAGTIVGFSQVLDPRTGYTVLPVRWDSAGRATELAHLGGQGWAQGVNQNGVIVGSSNDLPVYWDAAGNVTALPRLPDPGTYAAAANAVSGSGRIVGQTPVRRPVHHAVATDWPSPYNSANQLPDLGVGREYGGSAAWDVNDDGRTVGDSLKFTPDGFTLGMRAILWNPDGAMTELPNLGADQSGYSSTGARGVNAAGTVVGYSSRYADNVGIGRRAVTWDVAGDLTMLPALGTGVVGETNDIAYDINELGQVVGQAQLYVNQQFLGERAALWESNDRVVDLNLLTDAGPDWKLTFAYGINNKGWIVGAGLFDPDGPQGLTDPVLRPYLLIPLPEPVAGVLVPAASLLLLRRQRHQNPALY